MDDSESDLSIDDNHGAARLRISSKGLPFTTKLLLAWRHLDIKIDAEYDPARHQHILYIAEPGFHTTKLLSAVEAKQK